MISYYHVTPSENVEDILERGLEGGWGDVGFGVYVYAELGEAEDYASRGGWDNSHDPGDMAIIEIEADPSEVEEVVPDPEWPNPEDYEQVRFREMEEDTEETWRPVMRVLEDAPEP